MAVGKITYSYTPNTWSQEEFLRLGGFTVVFLNYNKAKFIEKSVASALAQDFPLCEMFFMDDASTDGSGDTMERLARAYRGRHKVTVVRNDENQHICGQWNIVSKLATGIWFGMFCGDDEAYPDRVSQVARLIRKYPSLKGVCTTGDEISGNDNAIDVDITHDAASNLVMGDCPMDRIRDTFHPVIGATAFWHRSLFHRPLPKAPLDDVVLRWVLIAKCRNQHSPVWLFDHDIKTIRYNVGTGITNSKRVLHAELLSPSRRWYERMKEICHFQSIMKRTMIGVKQYLVENGVDGGLIRIAQEEYLQCAIRAGGTWARVGLLPQVVRYRLLWGYWVKRFIAELFGLKFSSWILGRRAAR